MRSERHLKARPSSLCGALESGEDRIEEKQYSAVMECVIFVYMRKWIVRSKTTISWKLVWVDSASNQHDLLGFECNFRQYCLDFQDLF